MRITPLDIRKQEFKRVMRGLDGDEVHAFLNTIAEEYEAVLSDNKNLREKLVAIEERLAEYKSIETNLRNTLLTAEKLTHEAKDNARREASLIVRQAEMEAEKAPVERYTGEEAPSFREAGRRRCRHGSGR